MYELKSVSFHSIDPSQARAPHHHPTADKATRPQPTPPVRMCLRMFIPAAAGRQASAEAQEQGSGWAQLKPAAAECMQTPETLTPAGCLPTPPVHAVQSAHNCFAPEVH